MSNVYLNFVCRLRSAGARAFKIEGPNLKIGGEVGVKFLLILALKKHVENYLMQSKIILIGVTSSELLFSEHFCNYFE